MDQISALLKAAAKKYNRSMTHQMECNRLIMAASQKLIAEASYNNYGTFAGRPIVPYSVFSANGEISRPVRPDIYIADHAAMEECYGQLLQALRAGPADWSDADIAMANRVVYTAVLSVACCYDLWRRSSRKTPGTFFEIGMAALLQQMLPGATFTKHIPLAALVEDVEIADAVREAAAVGQEEGDAGAEDSEGDAGAEDSSVSTDLVIGLPGRNGGVVVPLKITTRERIVQPFAHQRILDAAFGEKRYRSLLVCISETQLDTKTRSVKQVCVPGTVKLFQKYLAPISGLYYCDIPQRYAAADMQRIIQVKPIGQFFKDVDQLLKTHSANRY